MNNFIFFDLQSMVLKQTIPSLFIQDFYSQLPRIKGYVSDLWPSSSPFMLEMALVKPRINTSGSICVTL